MRAAFVIVSYAKDLKWLCQGLQLLHKFWQGPEEVVVRLEEDCRPIVAGWLPFPRVRYVFTRRVFPDGYTYAMYEKLIADDYTDADYIMLLDSDHMLMRPASIDYLFCDGKPFIHYVDWDESPDPALALGKAKWSPPVQRLTGLELDKEYIVAPPFVFHRELFGDLRRRIVKVTGQSFLNAIWSDRPFVYTQFLSHPMTVCDYESLAVFAIKMHSERYVLRHARECGSPFHVFWSHEGFEQAAPKLAALINS